MLRAAALYFGIVFGAGFLLGIVRTLWLVPRVGERTAELIEIPFMLVVVFLAARFVVRRTRMAGRARRLAAGALALSFLVLAEAALVSISREGSLAEYVASRDPVSGSAYVLALALFAAAPAVVGDGRRGSARK